MYFKLAEDSLFRIYAQPHWVDIDLWLYRIGKTKTETIANGINRTSSSQWFLLRPTHELLLTTCWFHSH